MEDADQKKIQIQEEFQRDLVERIIAGDDFKAIALHVLEEGNKLFQKIMDVFQDPLSRNIMERDSILAMSPEELQKKAEEDHEAAVQVHSIVGIIAEGEERAQRAVKRVIEEAEQFSSELEALGEVRTSLISDLTEAFNRMVNSPFKLSGGQKDLQPLMTGEEWKIKRLGELDQEINSNSDTVRTIKTSMEKQELGIKHLQVM